MNSSIIGALNFDAAALAADLTRMVSFRYQAAYSDFIFGRWESCALYNGSGNAADNIISEYPGRIKPTALMQQLGYLQFILHHIVNMRHLRWLRVFVFHSGVILPHRDYLELKAGYTRLHIPLQTQERALHSEGRFVFHMRLGEIWFLDARSVHSACNLSTTPRVSLCLDFEPNIPLAELLKAPQTNPLPLPKMIAREAFSQEDKKNLWHRLQTATPESFREILAEVSTVHFHKNVHAGAMYRWLREISQSWTSSQLKMMAEETERFAILTRSSVAV